MKTLAGVSVFQCLSMFFRPHLADLASIDRRRRPGGVQHLGGACKQLHDTRRRRPSRRVVIHAGLHQAPHARGAVVGHPAAGATKSTGSETAYCQRLQRCMVRQGVGKTLQERDRCGGVA